jgi:hypothetical protein
MKKFLLSCIAALFLTACGGESSGYKTTIHVDFKDERLAPLVIADGKFFEPHWQQSKFVMYNKLEVGKTYNVWIDGHDGCSIRTYLIWDIQEVK